MQTLSTKQQINEILKKYNFIYNVPRGMFLFSSGDGDLIEKSPLGYYRFHFWHDGKIPRPHTNYIGHDKTLGHICVSLIKEEKTKNKYYRMLIRTELNTKSCIVTEDALGSFEIKETNKNIIAMGLSNYIFDEKRRRAQFGDENDQDEAISLFSVDGMTIRSEMSGRTSFLPHSRLKELSETSELDMLELHPVLLNTSTETLDDLEGSNIERTFNQMSITDIEDPKISRIEFDQIPVSKIISQMTSNSDLDFYLSLLELEDHFIPDKYYFDVIKEGEIGEEQWSCFCNFLGVKTEKPPEQEVEEEEPPIITNMNKMTNNTREKLIEELINTEASYLNRLNRLLNHKNALQKYASSTDRLFLGIEDLYQSTESLTKTLSEIKQTEKEEEIVKTISRLIVANISAANYKKYINNRFTVKTSLPEILSTHKIKKIVSSLDKKDPDRLRLVDLLIEPVQRIARYKLFLDEVIKLATEDERLSINTARKYVKDLILHMEKKDRDFYEYNELFQLLQIGLPVNLVNEKRKILNKKNAVLHSPNCPPQSCILVLLSDYLFVGRSDNKMLFISEIKSTNCQYKDDVHIKDHKTLFVDIDPEITIYGCSDEASRKTLFVFKSSKEPFIDFMDKFLETRDKLDPGIEKRVREVNGTRLCFYLDPSQIRTSGIPIILTNILDEKTIDKYSAYDAIAVAQCTNNSVRLTIKTKTEIYCTGEYHTIPDAFRSCKKTKDLEPFFSALGSYRRLSSLYPPFPKTQTKRMQRLLADIVRTTLKTKKSLFSSFKKKFTTKDYTIPSTNQGSLWKGKDESDLLKTKLVTQVTKDFLSNSHEFLLIEMICHVSLYIENAITDTSMIYIDRDITSEGSSILKNTIAGKKIDVIQSLGSQTPDRLCSFILLSLSSLSSEIFPKHVIEKSLESGSLLFGYKYRNFSLFIFGHFNRIIFQNKVDPSLLSKCIFTCLFEGERKKTSERQKIVRNKKDFLTACIQKLLIEPRLIRNQLR
eukprot:GHVP01000577.1.p1 GENE.GHVP01000577.1~~GHVP01000577.1.p1  ORF type:complete len:994 (-),score=174.13 GHVP01000577.1:548-3529(-)